MIEKMGEPRGIGWLEVNPTWVAGLWGLRATGEVRIVDGVIHVAVVGHGVRPGQVVVGMAATAVVPNGLMDRVDYERNVAKHGLPHGGDS